VKIISLTCDYLIACADKNTIDQFLMRASPASSRKRELLNIAVKENFQLKFYSYLSWSHITFKFSPFPENSSILVNLFQVRKDKDVINPN